MPTTFHRDDKASRDADQRDGLKNYLLLLDKSKDLQPCYNQVVSGQLHSINKEAKTTASIDEVTQLLLAWNQGDTSALHRLIPLVHDELKRLAHHYMSGERPGHTLQTTALVNEAYLRLVDSSRVRWQNRAQFFALSAQLMRRILVDFARSRNYQKRSGAMQAVSLDEAVGLFKEREVDLVALDDALSTLVRIDPRRSQVVELRFFGGLSEKEVAEVLKISPETVRRDWRLARVWLLRELARDSSSNKAN